MKEALLVVDVQNDVVQNAWNRDTVVRVIAQVVQKARESNIPIIWVQHNDDYLLKGSLGWEIVPELVPLPEEYHIYKEWGDAFVGTPLQQYLSELHISDLVIVGAQSDACIRMTRHGSVVRGYSVKLVSDAHTTDDSHYNQYFLSGEMIVAMENKMAMSTVLPNARSVVVTSKELWKDER